jgi:soluble lytic murein transglycosylase
MNVAGPALLRTLTSVPAALLLAAASLWPVPTRAQQAVPAAGLRAAAPASAPAQVQEAPAEGESSISRLANQAGVQSQVDTALDAEDEDGPTAPGQTRTARHAFSEEDLAGYFTSGVRAKAKAAFDRRQYALARELLEDEEDVLPVRYLRALSALQGGQLAAAADEFSALAEDSPALHDYCLFHAATAFERLGKRRDAAARYAAVPPGSLLFAPARFALSRLHHRRWDLPAAVAALTPLVQPGALDRSSTAPAEAWMRIAKFARILADYSGEHRALLALWATQPSSPEAAKVWERLRFLPIPAKWKVTRAETLISLHHNHEGMELLTRTMKDLQLPDEVACRAHFAYGLALRKERKHSAAIRALTPVVEQCRNSEVRPRAMYVLGYSQSVVDPASAVTTYQSLADDHPAHPYADDALIFAGQMAQHLGDETAALGHWAAVLERYPEHDSTAEALFQRFWVMRARGTPGEGLEALQRIEATSGAGASASQVRRARYWRARTLAELGRREEALALLEAQAGDASYYGLLARSRLQAEAPERIQRVLARLASPAHEGPAWPLDVGTMAGDRHFRAGLELLRMGLRREAASELTAIDSKAQGEEALLLLFRVLRQEGLERFARGVARSLLRVTLSGPTQAEARRMYELSYPQPFRPLVVQHSRAAGLDPDLMLALMREESGFNPRARSATGALGLAQLMPATAAMIARQLNVSGLGERSLFEPRHNIRLGSTYLGNLRRMFDGNLAHAVASYNAGPAAVERWRRRIQGVSLDEWVEEIPVDETRNYVKRVLGSYATYQLLNVRGTLTALDLGPPAKEATRPSGGSAPALTRTEGVRTVE